MNKKVIIGMHSINPAPVWNEPHAAPEKHLYGCVKKWQQLSRLTEYDKLESFNVVLNIFEAWAEDSKIGKSVMNSLWNSNKYSELQTSLQDLKNNRLNSIIGSSRNYMGSSPPRDIPWNDSNWAPLPSDLVAQLQAQRDALNTQG